jgi:hypothetical protein
MFTADQAVWLTVTFFIVGMGVGVVLTLTARPARPSRRPRRRPSVEEMANPDYNPSLDRSEAALRDVLGDEAERLASEYRKQEGDL